MGRYLLTVCIALAVASTAIAQTNAVDRGLAWIASQQHADGSWGTNAAVNALAVLAFYSSGHLPDTPRYGGAVNRGVTFLLGQEDADGSFTANGAWMYGQGIATFTLAQALGTTPHPDTIRPALERAVTLILRAQAIPKAPFHDGGWRYMPGSIDSDLSISAWQLLALTAAADAGLSVPRSSVERGADYLLRCAHPQGGFGYQPGGIPNQARTASAIVALRAAGHANDPALETGLRWLAQHPLGPDGPYYYYAAHACAHAGAGLDAGKLTAQQLPAGDWPESPHAPDEAKAGSVYRTAMAILALTADRHLLPGYLP
jgi:hypothetical protein